MNVHKWVYRVLLALKHSNNIPVTRPRWGVARGQLGLAEVRGVVLGEMPDGVLGYYDHSKGSIHVDAQLDRHSRRLTITHERFHKLLKHEPCGTPGTRVAREMLVERMTAEYFISFRALLDAYKACSDIAGLSRLLNVDPELVYARLNSLTKLERVILEVCAIRCIGVELSAEHPDGALVA